MIRAQASIYSSTPTWHGFGAVVLPTAVTAFLWATSPNNVAFEAGLSSFVLLSLAVWSYEGWKSRGVSLFPLFSLIAAAYWVYYGLPLFWGDRFAYGVAGTRVLTETAITQTMLLTTT